MKRYALCDLVIDSDNIIGTEMVKADDGEWVKYSDVEKEMKRIWGDIMPPPGDILKSLTKGA